MTRKNKWFSSLTPLSHKEYVTFWDHKKGKVLGTGIIKVNVYFTLNDVALAASIICSLSLSSLMLIWMCFFANLALAFSILLAILFEAFLALGRFSG
jgi:hypothetical protein